MTAYMYAFERGKERGRAERLTENDELRAAIKEYLQAKKHLDDAVRSHGGTRMEERRFARAEKALRRLAGGEQ